MDLVTFGEAMVRLTPPSCERLEQARSFDAHVGGAELNVAVAAGRLGLSTRWVSRLPENVLGRMIASRAREQGVDLHIDWAADARAGLYFLEPGASPRASSVLYDRAGSAISKIAPDTIDWSSAFRGARWFHVSGITPALGDSAAAVTREALAAAKTNGLTVSYDLNHRRKLWSADRARAVQEPLLEHVDVLVVTADDCREVLGAGDASHEEVALELAQRFALEAVAITLSGNPWSAVLAADGEIHRAPCYELQVVDRIGAGDAFCAGLIVGALEKRSWDDALRLATAAAALKHGIPGDFCLVTRAEVDELLSRGATMRVSR
jgi:2-dehydro-3-deoxygluconokinase